MSSRKASSIAGDFQRKVLNLDATRNRIEEAYLRRLLHLKDVESSYAGLFLQLVVAYETAIEDFVLGLLVRPGGVKSSKGYRARVTVRSYGHAQKLAGGPSSNYPSWIGQEDVKNIADLLLHNGGSFRRADPPVDWHFVQQARYIRNAIAHPSQHALTKFQKHVLQATPLPPRERTVSGYLRGRVGPQTRWEIFAAGLVVFIGDTVV